MEPSRTPSRSAVPGLLGTDNAAAAPPRPAAPRSSQPFALLASPQVPHSSPRSALTARSHPNHTPVPPDGAAPSPGRCR